METPQVPAELTSLLLDLPYFQGTENISSFITEISRDIKLRQCEPGEAIVKYGERAKCMFFLLKGTVVVTSQDAEVTFAELSQGNYFGEIGVLMDSTRNATVLSKTKCSLGILSRESLFQTLEKFPDVKDILVKKGQERVTEIQEKLKSGQAVGHHRRSSLFPKFIPFHRPSQESASNSAEDVAAGQVDSAVSVAESLTLLEKDKDRKSWRRPSIGYAPEKDEKEEMPLSPLIPEGPDDRIEGGSASKSSSAQSISKAYQAFKLDSEEEEASDSDVETTDSSHSNVSGMAGSQQPSRRDILFQMIGGVGPRRASVAVWSDAKLAQMAQNIANKQAGIGSGKTTRSSRKSAVGTAPVLEETKEDEETKTNHSSTGHLLSDQSNFLRILKHLDIFNIVKLQRLSKRAQSWIDVGPLHADFSPRHKDVNDAHLTNILNTLSQNLWTLDLRHCWLVTNAGMSRVYEFGAELRMINLSSVWELTDEGIMKLAQRCPNLQHLNVGNCRKLTNLSVLSVVAQCKDLKWLNLSYCKNLSDEVLDHPGWSNLECLNLHRCTGIYDQGFERWRKFGSAFHLRQLVLSDCSFLTDAAIKAIAQTCPNLEKLSLSFCCSLNGEFINSLAAGCPHLRVLDVAFCGAAMSDVIVDDLAHQLPELNGLSLRGCVGIGPKTLESLLAFATSLRMLNISQTPLWKGGRLSLDEAHAQEVKEAAIKWKILVNESLFEVQ